MDFFEAIISGIGRIKSEAFLIEYYRRWASEIESNDKKAEIIAAFGERKRDLLSESKNKKYK